MGYSHVPPLLHFSIIPWELPLINVVMQFNKTATSILQYCEKMFNFYWYCWTEQSLSKMSNKLNTRKATYGRIEFKEENESLKQHTEKLSSNWSTGVIEHTSLPLNQSQR